MNKHTPTDPNDLASLAEDARTLMAATADVAGEKVSEARNRLAAALDSGKEIYGRVKDKAVEGAKAADEVVRENPYQAIAIGVGVGVLVGYLLGVDARAIPTESAMEPAGSNLGQIVEASKHLARRLFTIGENRLELLIVEVEEARRCFLHALMLALAVGAFGTLALLALNIAIIVWLWNCSPVLVLLGMAGVYAVLAGCLYYRLARLLREWKMLSTTLEQLRKDRECLENLI